MRCAKKEKQTDFNTPIKMMPFDRVFNQSVKMRGHSSKIYTFLDKLL